MPMVFTTGGSPPAAEMTPDTIELLLYPVGMSPSGRPGIGEMFGMPYQTGTYRPAAAIRFLMNWQSVIPGGVGTVCIGVALSPRLLNSRTRRPHENWPPIVIGGTSLHSQTLSSGSRYSAR